MRLGLVAHEALRLVFEYDFPDYNERGLKRVVGENLGILHYDETSIDRGVDAEIAETARFDTADEEFEPVFQQALEALCALRLLERQPGSHAVAPRCAILGGHKPAVRERIAAFLAETPYEPRVSRTPRSRTSALAV